jgi:hypothetical protein
MAGPTVIVLIGRHSRGLHHTAALNVCMNNNPAMRVMLALTNDSLIIIRSQRWLAQCSMTAVGSIAGEFSIGWEQGAEIADLRRT